MDYPTEIVLNESMKYENRKSKISLWKYVDVNDLDALYSCFDYDPLKQKSSSNTFLKNDETLENEYNVFSRLIASQLNLNSEIRKNDGILIDAYYYLVKFALSKSFCKEQTSTLITLFKETHELAVSTSFDNIEETFDYFKKMLINYSVHHPPFRLAIYSPKEAELVLDYIYNSYFKQYKAYKCAFTPTLYLTLKINYDLKEEPEIDNQIKLENELDKSDKQKNYDINIIQESNLCTIESVQENINVVNQDSTLEETKTKDEISELRTLIRSLLVKKVDDQIIEMESEKLEKSKVKSASTSTSKLKPKSAQKYK
jgi:hypothetical protein